MAAANVTVIGRASRVRGNLTGEGDLEVQGFVGGEITVSGDVTIDAQGLVDANVRGRRIVVRGAIRGHLIGEESVFLEEGARVVGDVRAPRVAIGQGALVRGYVQTGDTAPPATAARGRAASTADTRAQTAPRPAVRPAPPPAPRAAVPAPKPAPKADPAPAREAPAPNTPAAAGPRRPPPPVVPALKKMRGQILKKKER
jgi:cytoskeletal protein CcmA (bactofilin family)